MEQKNFDAVRKTVGSFRFDTPAEYAALGEVYQFLYHYGHPSFKVLLKDKRPMDDTRKSTKRNPNRLVEGVQTAKAQKEAKEKLLKLNREKGCSGNAPYQGGDQAPAA